MKGLALDWRALGWGLLRWALAGVFIYAGLTKLRDAAGFASSIARFQIAPLFLVNPAALGLPPLEVFCGLALVAGPWKRQASFALILLSVLFLGAFLSAGVRGIAVECHCFGGAAAEPLWKSITRDVLLLGAAVAVHLRLRNVAALQRRALRFDSRHSSTFFLSFS